MTSYFGGNPDCNMDPECTEQSLRRSDEVRAGPVGSCSLQASMVHVKETGQAREQLTLPKIIPRVYPKNFLRLVLGDGLLTLKSKNGQSCLFYRAFLEVISDNPKRQKKLLRLKKTTQKDS